MNTVISVDDVRDVVVDTLGLSGPTAVLTADSPLLGAVAELDSLAVLELITACEARFGVAMEDEDISAETFATLGSLAEVVAARSR